MNYNNYKFLSLQLFSNVDLDDSWRQLALEVIVTLSETAPAMIRKVSAKYIPELVPRVLHLMTDLEDDPEWSIGDEIVEEDSDRYAISPCIKEMYCYYVDKTLIFLVHP